MSSNSLTLEVENSQENHSSSLSPTRISSRPALRVITSSISPLPLRSGSKLSFSFGEGEKESVLSPNPAAEESSSVPEVQKPAEGASPPASPSNSDLLISAKDLNVVEVEALERLREGPMGQQLFESFRALLAAQPECRSMSVEEVLAVLEKEGKLPEYPENVQEAVLESIVKLTKPRR